MVGLFSNIRQNMPQFHINNPLCFTALEANSTISFRTLAANIMYSGDNWNWFNFSYNDTIITLENIGDKVYMCGENESLFDPNTATITNFSMTGRIAASGDVTTLLNLNGLETLTALGCFLGLFENCTSLETAPELPATTLSSNCYGAMFRGCTNLTVAPHLPATTLAENCYWAMFAGCESLCEVTVEGNITAYEADGWLDNSNVENAGFIYGDVTIASELIPQGWLHFPTKEDFCYGKRDIDGEGWAFAYNGNMEPTHYNIADIYLLEDETKYISIYWDGEGVGLTMDWENWWPYEIEYDIHQLNGRQLFVNLMYVELGSTAVRTFEGERLPDPVISGTDNTMVCWNGEIVHKGTGTIAIVDGEIGSTIHYSIDNGGWEIYSQPFEVESGTHTIKSYATKSGFDNSRMVSYQITVSEEEECPPAPERLRIVNVIRNILDGMVEDEYCDLQSWQYNDMATSNVKLDSKKPSPTAVCYQITDFEYDLNTGIRRERANVLVAFLQKESKLDAEGLEQDQIIKEMSDIAFEFMSKVMSEGSLRILNDKIKLKSTFLRSDSNRTGVVLELELEEKSGTCFQQ